MNELEIVKQYYKYFNELNWEGMLSLVSDDIRHEPNEGEARIGTEPFKAFLNKMDTAYQETLTNQVFFTSEDDTSRIATEFTVNGIYKISEPGLPEAKGQKYVLPAGAFLEVKNGKIARITTYYNLDLWIRLVSE
ncbi:MAG: nuclear transport factor 2 family protein [Flavobacteriia bacterium]|nr:nuclear transport factor 2 family protein [Flavobacteriia bacterium]OJX37129.1 MAG: isopropylmalate/homocitrate/citramalate synthase [Flavobacteriia bacterium 40-80]